MSYISGSAMIEARELTKAINGFTAIRGVSFEVKEGEVFAFLGPNGAAKITTIKKLTTLLRPRGGTVHLTGIDGDADFLLFRRSVSFDRVAQGVRCDRHA